MPKPKFNEEIINIASLRLDSIVAKLSNTSRSKGLDLISSGKVLVDYKAIREKSLEIKMGSRLTIRGYGKYIVDSILGETKSGKKKVKIKKYC